MRFPLWYRYLWAAWGAYIFAASVEAAYFTINPGDWLLVLTGLVVLALIGFKLIVGELLYIEASGTDVSTPVPGFIWDMWAICMIVALMINQRLYKHILIPRKLAISKAKPQEND